jgi:hypothetical protein
MYLYAGWSIVPQSQLSHKVLTSHQAGNKKPRHDADIKGISKLIESTPKRIQMLVKNRGIHKKYSG